MTMTVTKTVVQRSVRLVATTALAFLAVGPAPALAAPLATAADPGPSPTMAGLASALGPFAVAGAALVVYAAGNPNEKPVMVAALMPLAVGAGQAYAGDPKRGLAVGAGAYAATAVGLGGGLAFATRPPLHMPMNDAIGIGLLGAGAVVLGYYAWSIVDAAGTADRARRAAAAPAINPARE